MSEYDPILTAPPADASEDLDEVRLRFAAASRPYLASPWSWLAWGAILPAAALASGRAHATWGPAGVLFLWSGAILLGGAFEAAALLRHRARSALGGWAMRMQGNLSLIAVALSLVLLGADAAWALPGLWLLVTGHSFYMLGSLALPGLRRYGLAYQAGGAVALAVGRHALLAFAITTALANLGLALALLAARRARAGGDDD